MNILQLAREGVIIDLAEKIFLKNVGLMTPEDFKIIAERAFKAAEAFYEEVNKRDKEFDKNEQQ